MEKELAIVLPYLFDSDLQYNSGGTPSMVTAIIAAGRNWTIDYHAGQACDVVIKVLTCIKTAWNIGTEWETCLQRCLRPLQLYGDQALCINTEFTFQLLKSTDLP